MSADNVMPMVSPHGTVASTHDQAPPRSQSNVRSEYPGLIPLGRALTLSDKIITIHPTDLTAKLAFSDLAEQIRNKQVFDHHTKFIHVNQERQDLHHNTGDISSDTETHEAEKNGPATQIWGGYYSIGFELPSFTNTAMWSIGRGSSKHTRGLSKSEAVQNRHGHRHVDILLTNHRHHGTRLHSVHALLKIHPESGAWMLSAGSSCQNVESATVGQSRPYESCTHETIILNNEKLRHFEARCLTQTQSNLIVGGMSFMVQFSLRQTEQEESYIQLRNQFLVELPAPVPATTISGIPFWSDYRTRHAVWREPIGSGAFGVVFAGVNPVTGALRAIKKWAVIKKNQRDQVVQEIKVSEALNRLDNKEGLVKVFGWSNGSGEEKFLQVPTELLLFMEHGTTFKDHDWAKEMSELDWPARNQLWKQLVKQLLKGLESLHKLGWMHRDVTPQNILYFSATGGHPPQAKLCDFGKVSTQPTSNDPHLAALMYRAPEVGEGYYTQKIDIWGLGLVLLYNFFHRAIGAEQMMRKEEDHRIVKERLLEVREGEAGTAGPSPWAELIDLMLIMLSFESKDRPTPTQALCDPAFAELQSADCGSVGQDSSKTSFSHDGKRLRGG